MRRGRVEMSAKEEETKETIIFSEMLFKLSLYHSQLITVIYKLTVWTPLHIRARYILELGKLPFT